MYTEAQYEADCQLIDKMIVIHAGLTQDPDIIKQAGIADQLGGVAQTIYQAVSDRVERDGVIATLATYLSPMMLSRIWPPLYVLVPAASLFGFDIGAVFKKVIDLVTEVISSTGNFTNNDAASIADEATSEMTKGASLEPLRMLEKRGQIVDAMQGKLIKHELNKKAIPTRTRGYSGQQSSNGILGKIFRYFGNSRISKILFGGVVRWFIMAVLTGVALFEGPKILGKVLGIGSTDGGSSSSESSLGESSYSTPSSSSSQTIQYNLPPVVSHNLKPSGQGEQYHTNTDRTLWIVNMSGNVPNTLWLWAKAIYPELSEHRQKVFASRSFNRMVSIILGANQRVDTEYLQMPPNSGLHTWKDVVDRFVGEVAASI